MATGREEWPPLAEAMRDDAGEIVVLSDEHALGPDADAMGGDELDAGRTWSEAEADLGPDDDLEGDREGERDDASGVSTHERDLVQRWLDIGDRVIRPLLQSLAAEHAPDDEPEWSASEARGDAALAAEQPLPPQPPPQQPPPQPPPAYGGYDLARGDRDDGRRWGGAPRSAALGHVMPAAGARPFVEQLQRDLRTVGFAIVGRADGGFGRTTEWAVREFQIYAKMQSVAQEAPPPVAPAVAPARYVDRLARIANTQRYVGPVSGVVNADTRAALQHWVTNRWRCPVVVEAWDVDASGARTRLRNENIWLHNEVPVPARRMFVRDFSGYHPLPATRNANDLVVLGQFAAFGAFGGPSTERPRFAWAEAEMTPENLVGTALAALTPAQRSTYKTIRAVSEVECNGYFDVINAYDDVFVSLGPYHWPIGNVADALGDLGAYLAFLRHADAAAFEQAIEFFGVRPSREWARPGHPDGQDLFAAGSRRHMGWLSLAAEGGAFNPLRRDIAEANYFRSWHWIYRFAMAGRTIGGFRRRMWDMARRRLLDIRETPWGAGVPDVPLAPPGVGTRPATIGDVYTSERALALVLRWHVRCPAHMVNAGRAGARLRAAFARARIPATAGNPTRWTDAHEQALITGLLDEAQSITVGCGARGLHQTLSTVHDWPTWATGAHPPNPWNYSLDPTVGRLNAARNSSQFDATGLPVSVAPAAPPPPAAPVPPGAPVPAPAPAAGAAGAGAEVVRLPRWSLLPDESPLEELKGDWKKASARDAFEEAVLSTPDQDERASVGVAAVRIPGLSSDVALVFAGVHGSEPEGVEAARRLLDKLKEAAARGKKPKLTMIVIPELIAKARRSSKRAEARWVPVDAKLIEPNRNFPAPGESYDYARERGRTRKDGAELLDCRGEKLDGDKVTHRMLAETRILVQLIEREKPACAISIHSHGVPGTRGDGPGIFVDPRGGFNEHTDTSFTNSGRFDDRLTKELLDAALAQIGPSLPLASDDGKKRLSHPFLGNLADSSGKLPATPTATVHYTSTRHPCGTSFGLWAPEPDKLGVRKGVTTLTLELPRYDAAGKALDLVIDTHVQVLLKKFLG